MRPPAVPPPKAVLRTLRFPLPSPSALSTLTTALRLYTSLSLSAPPTRLPPRDRTRTFTARMSTSAPGAAAPQFEPMATSFEELAPFVRLDASKALAGLLSDNHAKHHCFFNTRGMHNHSAHQLVADLTLGATASQLTQHYDYQVQHYLGAFSLNDRSKFDPHFSSPHTTSDAGKEGVGAGKGKVEVIGEANWGKHVGNARYYWSYLHFFDALLAEQPATKVLEKYVFSPEANEGGRAMLVRFYGGVLHALIHVGYGLETGQRALVAEGLAMATSTAASHAWLFDYTWLVSPPPPSSASKNLLELVTELQTDPRLSVESLRLKDHEASLPDAPFDHPEAPGFGVIQSYVDAWLLSTCTLDASEVMGELAVFCALMLGAVPAAPSGHYQHDFFLMHLNNAHLFSPLFLAALPLDLHRVYLRAFAAQCLYYYICRGRPSFSTAQLAAELHTDLDWPNMFDVATRNVDEHLPKAVRALYVANARYAGWNRYRGFNELLSNDAQEAKGQCDSEGVFKLTARQLVRMHKGELQPSKYATDEARENGESVGAHQEFWSFEPFF